MAGTMRGGSPTGPGGQGRRRARQPTPRTRTVEFTLNAQEYGNAMGFRCLTGYG